MIQLYFIVFVILLIFIILDLITILFYKKRDPFTVLPSIFYFYHFLFCSVFLVVIIFKIFMEVTQ